MFGRGRSKTFNQKNNGIDESMNFSILIGLGCLGGAGRKGSTNNQFNGKIWMCSMLIWSKTYSKISNHFFPILIGILEPVENIHQLNLYIFFILIWNCWIRLQRLNQQKHEMGQMPFSTSRKFKQKWKRFNQNNKNSAKFKSRTEQFEFCLVWDVWERPVEKTFNQKKLWDRFNQSNFQF